MPANYRQLTGDQPPSLYDADIEREAETLATILLRRCPARPTARRPDLTPPLDIVDLAAPLGDQRELPPGQARP